MTSTPTTMRPERIAWLWGLSTLLMAGSVDAYVVSEDPLEEESTELGVVFRNFGFLFAGDVLEPPLTPEDQNPSASGLFDARMYFQQRGPDYKIVAHEQLTLRLFSYSSSSPLALGRGLRPPRWLPLTFRKDDPTLVLQSDLDWLYAGVTWGPVTITAGRQPITFGRGKLWHTTDRISTFALTEVDRSYKPGADALRLDWAIAEQTRLKLFSALGELESKDLDAEVSLRGSSFVARFEQGWEESELGVTAGFIRYDAILGVDGVIDLGDWSLYAELTATKLTANSLTTPAVAPDDRDVPVFSALLGATLRPVDSLTLIPELHFNGFGAWNPAQYLQVAQSERVAIGEQLGLGKLYAGLATDWEVHPLTHLTTATLLNPRDPSALFAFGLTHNVAENVDLILGTYLPTGFRPNAAAVAARSEYGNYPYFVYTELKGTI